MPCYDANIAHPLKLLILTNPMLATPYNDNFGQPAQLCKGRLLANIQAALTCCWSVNRMQKLLFKTCPERSVQTAPGISDVRVKITLLKNNPGRNGAIVNQSACRHEVWLRPFLTY
eukprot:904348-Pelagomonas_calceolata.AAC.6